MTYGIGYYPNITVLKFIYFSVILELFVFWN